ncbi:phage terminase large subunit [Ochrobactrum sp. S1502_03]|uniref:phage terminase large subunit n=1 Tax=Ochrobactrum sp. S1502_03 TaxID=3108451 RepID=UPI0037CC2EC8
MTIQLTKKQQALLPLLGRQGTKHTLIYGGSRSGKTFLTCYAIATRALRAEGSRHGIFRKHAVAVKQSVGRDTFPKVMRLAYPDAAYKWYEQDGVFVYGNGAEVWCAGLDDKERVDKVLGKEYATIYENEASELSYDAHTTLMTRLAQNVQANVGHPGPLPLRNYVDLNPTTQSHWTYKLFVQGVDPESKRPINRGDYSHYVANPMDNHLNLPPDYLESLKYLPEAKRKRFFLGEFSGDAEDALWSRGVIERLYVLGDDELPDFVKIVVSVDPATSSNPGSDETGIVVCAIDKEGYGYVLEDASGVMKPEEWAKRAVTLYNYYKADCIVAEKNQGGEMVESTIQAQAKGRWIPVKLVHASRGKVVRAEPISALYARRRVRHVREFTELEDQMCSFTTGFDRSSAGYSPDRVDALVWGFTELFPGLIEERPENIPLGQMQTVAPDEPILDSW